MEEEKTTGMIDPIYLLRLVGYYRWVIIIVLLLTGLGGILATQVLTKTYSASTLILVQPQRVPSDYVQSLVTVDIESRINSLSQEILSRTNLEKIIAKFNLFVGPEYQDVYMEDKVEQLRRHISVEVTRDRRGRGSNAESFTITFEGSDPRQVRDVANTLASFFIDENIRLRESQAVGTSSFLDEELESMRKRLEVTEQKLKNYRQGYMGSLPEQLDTNLSILERLQEELSERQANLRDAKARLITLRNLQSAGYETGETGAQGEGEAGMSLEAMRSELERLQARYTAKHPDIVRLKQTIAEAEKSGASSIGTRRDTPEILEVRNEIANIEASIQQTRQQIALYQTRVEATPQREQELNALQRDYENMQASYESLLNRKLEADISVNMERKQKGEQFRVIDPARLPQRPSSPNMPQLFLITLAAGFGIAGGIIFLREYLSKTARQPKLLGKDLDLPVLATFPVIRDAKQRLYGWVERIMAWSAGLVTCLVYALFALLVLLGDASVKDLVARL